MVGWDSTDNKLAQLAEWLYVDNSSGNIIDKHTTLGEMKECNTEDFCGDNMFVQDPRGY